MINFFTNYSLLFLMATLFIACDPVQKDSNANTTQTNEENSIEVIIEIPAGTSMKYEMDKESGEIVPDIKNGKERRIDYLSYPANYGLIPGTLQASEDGGDGDPLDVIVLGPALERGIKTNVRPIAILELFDSGEKDDKVIAVQAGTAFEEVTSLRQLQEEFPGVIDILSTWFLNYKGPGKMELMRVGDEDRAVTLIEEMRIAD